MQPLIYLGVRTLLSWLQFRERADRAFVRSSLLTVAAGALHCWAVVYALFVAVHTRAMRYEGYHEGYTEHLPSSVAWSETLTEASLWIWLIAGFTQAAVRILDEDADIDLSGQTAGPLTKLMRSPALHSGLAMVHSVSCAGLFVGILVLSGTMAAMKGGITAGELCLVVVAIAFAAPHVIVAIRRMSPEIESIMDSMIAPHYIECAAAEAASVSPQLCVVLALADAPGHAYLWQNLLYFLASIAVVAAIVISGYMPSQKGDTALPPEVHETFSCLVMNAAAAMCMVLSFPHMNTWFTWASVLCYAVFVVAGFPLWRDFVMEWLEQVFVVRSDRDKRIPAPMRQRLRIQAWILCMLASATALWDIKFHPTETIMPTPMSKEGLLMFRYQMDANETAPEMLAIAAIALDVHVEELKIEEYSQWHRLFIFKHLVPKDASDTPLFLRWVQVMTPPQGKLQHLVDQSFPATLNAAMCSSVRSAHEEIHEKKLKDMINVLKADAREAYLAACDWWDRRLIGSHDGDHVATPAAEKAPQGGGKAPPAAEKAAPAAETAAPAAEKAAPAAETEAPAAEKAAPAAETAAAAAETAAPPAEKAAPAAETAAPAAETAAPAAETVAPAAETVA